MPDRSRQPNALPALLIALGVVMLFLVLSLATTTVAAQSDATGTPEPTSAFSLNLPPTLASSAPTPTVDPAQIPSLTGVGGQAVNAAVVIRSGPGLGYPAISYLKQDGWINIVGWSGWSVGRACSPEFKADLDMWVQVQAGEGRGWIARCVLSIRGKITDLPIVTASGVRLLQR